MEVEQMVDNAFKCRVFTFQLTECTGNQVMLSRVAPVSERMVFHPTNLKILGPKQML